MSVTMTTGHALARFARQLTVPGFGMPQQHRLRRATALVAGVGGVGGAAATYLAAAGVGRLVLAHPGVLEPPDLNRQTLMRPDHLGSPRAGCAAETLRRHYPDVAIDAFDLEMAHPRLATLIAEAQVVVDARHNFPERYLLNQLCLARQVPLVVAAMNATEATLLTLLPQAEQPAGAPPPPCLRCVFPQGDPAWQPLGFPVLGAVAGTVGCLAAMEAIKVVTGFGQPVSDRLVHLDLWDMHFQELRVRADPACPDCATRGRDGSSG